MSQSQGHHTNMTQSPRKMRVGTHTNPPPFNIHGEYHLHHTFIMSKIAPSALPVIRCHISTLCNPNGMLSINYSEARPHPHEYESNRRVFLNESIEVIRHTFDSTTRYHCYISSPSHIIDTQRTPYPSANVHQSHEPVTTDMVYADIFAVSTLVLSLSEVYVSLFSLPS